MTEEPIVTVVPRKTVDCSGLEPSSDAVEVLSETLARLFPLDGAWNKYGKRVIELIEKQGYTITRAVPVMSDDELFDAAKSIATIAFSVSRVELIDKIAEDIANLAKKYRGQS